MTEKLKQIIKEQVVKLPKETQDVINSIDWVKRTEEIGKKYLLSENELTDFQVETLLVLIGFEYPDLYRSNIESNTTISKDKIIQLIEEALQKIFTPMNDIFIENIKKSGKIKNSNPEQTLDFILSGGDYSSFLTPATEDVPSLLDKEGTEGRFLNDALPPRLSATPQEGNKPRKMDDLRSKFTI